MLGYLTLLVGFILIYVHVVLVPKPPVVEYRYLPRDLDQMFQDSAFNSDTFTPMFDESGPWIKAHTDQMLT